MKNVYLLAFLVITSVSQSGFARSEIDWGVFSVRVEERNFRCDGNISNNSFQFYLMPRLISKNEFRSSDPGIKLEHHFSYYFTDESEDTCEYKRQLLKIAAKNGGNLDVRLITSDAIYRKYTAVSEYGVVSCVAEVREKLRVEFPIGLATTSSEQNVKRLHFGECSAE